MKLLYYGITVVCGLMAILSILRFGEMLVFGNIGSQTFVQLAIGLLLGVVAIGSLKRARAS